MPFGGFTLLEMMCAIVIIAILMLLLVQGLAGWQQQADKGSCINNLAGLYTAATAYIQDQEHWPQISGDLAVSDEQQYAREWYQALGKYGIGPINFVCPTVQRELRNPDLHLTQNARCDYIATPFDNGRWTPYRWPTQPWFIEKSASHPGANLMVFCSGTTKSLVDVFRDRGAPGQ